MTRFAYVMTTYVTVLALGGLSFVQITPRLIWNVSASTPIGLYDLRSVRNLTIGDLVAVDVPEPLASFLAERGSLPRGVPLLKHVVALPGQQVCRTGRIITVDAIAIGKARTRDRRGRALPVWQGCRILAEGDVFLMNPGVSDSFDGRYFGPTARRLIIGHAVPLWLKHPPSGG